MTWGWPCCCDRPDTPVLRIVLIMEDYQFFDPDYGSLLVCMDGQYEIKWQSNLTDDLALGYVVKPTSIKLYEEDVGYVYVTYQGISRYEFDPDLSQDMPIYADGLAKLKLLDGTVVWHTTPVEQPLGFSFRQGASAPRIAKDFNGDVVVTSGSLDYVAYAVTTSGVSVRTYAHPTPFFSWGFYTTFPSRTLSFDSSGNAYMTAQPTGFGNGTIHKWDQNGTWIGQPWVGRTTFNGPSTISASETLIHDGILYDGHSVFEVTTPNFTDTELVGCDPLDISMPRGRVRESDFGADFSINQSWVRRACLSGNNVILNTQVMYNREPWSIGGYPQVTRKQNALGNVVAIPQGTVGGALWQSRLWYGSDADTTPPQSISGNTLLEYTQPCLCVTVDPVSGSCFAFVYPVKVFNAFNKPSTYQAPYRVLSLNPGDGSVSSAGYEAPEALPQPIYHGEALTAQL